MRWAIERFQHSAGLAIAELPDAETFFGSLAPIRTITSDPQTAHVAIQGLAPAATKTGLDQHEKGLVRVVKVHSKRTQRQLRCRRECD